jgi:serine/threonine protein kinase
MLKNNYLVEFEEDADDPKKHEITGKITDFGLSSILGSKIHSASSKLSDAVKWQAPELAKVREESFEGREKLLEKADVWSFGITSLEVSQHFKC